MLIIAALIGLSMLLALTIRLTLLLRLIHRIQNTEVVLRMLEKRLGSHAVATAGRISTKLQILLKKLLCSAADPDLGPIAVEYMVAVQRHTTA